MGEIDARGRGGNARCDILSISKIMIKSILIVNKFIKRYYIGMEKTKTFTKANTFQLMRRLNNCFTTKTFKKGVKAIAIITTLETLVKSYYLIHSITKYNA
jgi:hypothetical protein